MTEETYNHVDRSISHLFQHESISIEIDQMFVYRSPVFNQECFPDGLQLDSYTAREENKQGERERERYIGR